MSRIQSSGNGGNNGGSGSGNVTGVPPTTIGDIAVWGNNIGTIITDSLAAVQTGGAVIAQGFVFDRQIINDITIPNHYTMINSDMELVSGDVYLLGDAQLILL